MNLNVNKEEIAMRVLDELLEIAFGCEVKVNHKLTAIRLLMKFLSLDKPEKEAEGEDTVFVVDDMLESPDFIKRGKTQRPEQTRSEQTRSEQTRSERTQPENRRQRRERERTERREQTRSERTQSERM
ncbi:MAG: hypothetical protein LBI36_04845 [Oscillospiraceae bacterium]|jgi:hypothetical protein|nr:hypothetical protein [Oscillospiraceae bacterium]